MKTPESVTDNNVGGKTPDMAKENNFVLREAAKAACDGYYTHLQNGGKGDPSEERWIEALTAGADAITQVAVLKSRLAQVERERDAAVKCLEKIFRTPDKNFPSPDDAVYCTRLAKISISDYMTGDWRGVCEGGNT